MAPAANNFRVYDVVTATDRSIQFSHDHGLPVPPTDEVTVLAIDYDGVLTLSDGSNWHHSHFRLVRRPDVPELDQDESLVGEFNEFDILDEVREYIAKTYGEHYAKDGVQAFALIAKRPERGLNFALSNVIKYADRFGEKGGRNRKDLLKVAHYSVLAIYCLDKLEGRV